MTYNTDRAHRAVSAGWGEPTKDETWDEMIQDLRHLAEEYGQDLEKLVLEAFVESHR